MPDHLPETPQEIRFERDAWKRFSDRGNGRATASGLFAQVAPTPEEEHRILQLPHALGNLPLQNAAGQAYFMLDYDAIDDPNHPVRPDPPP